MKPLFLDTSYLLALELANDQNHQAASQHWQGYRARPQRLLTTSYIFDEVVTYFNSRGHHAKAVQIGYTLLQSPTVELVPVKEKLFRAAWAYFEQHADKRYSFTDCVSFVLMQRRGVTTALTFDGHFVQAGFQRVP